MKCPHCGQFMAEMVNAKVNVIMWNCGKCHYAVQYDIINRRTWRNNRAWELVKDE